MSGLTLLALLASGLLGVSDFLGGVLSRRIPLMVVLLVSQVAATVAVSTRLLVEPFDPDAADAILWGLIGGLATAVGVSALFRGLAIGTMGVVAPITSLSVAVPVIVGVSGGDPISWILGLGLAVAVVGTVLASGPEVRAGALEGRRNRLLSIVFAVISALGFGLTSVSVAYGSADSVSTTLVVMMVVVLGIYLVTFSAWVHVRLRGAAARLRAGLPASPALLPTPLRPRDWVGMASIGLLGYAAQLSFALASLDGALSVVAVLAALYPVVTAVLGWRLLGEHLLRMQIVGVALVVIGVATIAGSA